MKAIPTRHLKIGGREEFLETAQYELLPDVILTINSLPFGFDEMMERELPSPRPPKKPKTDGMGNPVYLDKAKKIMATAEDREDPDFVAKEKAQSRRQSAFMIYHGTKHDKQLEWDVDREGVKPEKFYQAIYDELVNADIGAGRILGLVKAIMELSGMTKEKMDRVADTFLSAAGEGN